MAISIICDCGKQLRAKDEAAGKRVNCPACGTPLNIPVGNMDLGIDLTEYREVPLVTQAPIEQDEEVTASSKGGLPWLWVGLGVFCAVVLGIALILDNKMKVDKANQTVAVKVDEARIAAKQRQWDRSIEILRGALTTERATNLSEARSLLDESTRAKQEADRAKQEAEIADSKQEAERLLANAREKLQNKEINAARFYLKEYMANPHSQWKDLAKALLEVIDYATSESTAREVLSTLSDYDFKRFSEQGRLKLLDDITENGVKEVFAENLRKQLPAERQKRMAKEAEQQEQARMAKLQREADEKEREQKNNAQQSSKLSIDLSQINAPEDTTRLLQPDSLAQARVIAKDGTPFEYAASFEKLLGGVIPSKTPSLLSYSEKISQLRRLNKEKEVRSKLAEFYLVASAQDRRSFFKTIYQMEEARICKAKNTYRVFDIDIFVHRKILEACKDFPLFDGLPY